MYGTFDMVDRYNLLHVDDDDDIRTIVELATNLDPDFSVRGVSDGASAITLLRRSSEWQPNVLILDYKLPDMSGYDLLGHIRKLSDFAHVPIIFMTARVNCESEAEAETLGAAGFIAKPFDPLTLAQDIRRIIGQP